MWAQSWLQLYDICEPYPNKPSVDITPALVEQVTIIYQHAKHIYFGTQK